MLDLVLLAAAAQVQTIRLPPPIAQVPPVPSAPVRMAVPEPVQIALPDLAIGGLRVISEQLIQIEVRNQGTAATAGPVRLRSCVSLGEGYNGVYTTYCSPLAGVGGVAAGKSKWVKIDCFLDHGSVGPGSGGGGLFGGSTGSVEVRPPQCVSLMFGGPKIAKYDAYVDPAPRGLAEGPRAAPAAVQPACGDDFGCVRETNEDNNRREFEAPFDK